jgi:hypothetical protein
MAIRFRRPRYAEIVATLALFIAMGGTAYAATALPKNSVGTDQIKKHAVTTSKLNANSVSLAKMQAGSVDGTKVVDNSLSGLQIADNSIDSGEIVDGSVLSVDIADGSVTNSKIDDNAIDGSKVANESLTLSDLQGANVNGAISFTLGAGACATLNMTAGGAQVGQAAFFSWAGSTTPAKIVIGPMRVSSAGHVEGVFCNLASSTASFSNQAVRIVTFG